MAPDHNHIIRPKFNNLLTRLLSAIVLLPLAVLAILTGGIPYFTFVILITILIIFEWNGITEKKIDFSTVFFASVKYDFTIIGN